MKVEPIHDRLLVRRIQEAEKLHAGLLHLPDSAKEKPQEGIVLSIGTGRILESGAVVPLRVKVGDRILFAKYAGTDLRVNDEEVLVLREDEVLLILRPEEGDIQEAPVPPAPGAPERDFAELDAARDDIAREAERV